MALSDPPPESPDRKASMPRSIAPYYEGYLAAHHRKSRLANGKISDRPFCPFEFGTPQHHSWLQGVIDNIMDRQRANGLITPRDDAS